MLTMYQINEKLTQKAQKLSGLNFFNISKKKDILNDHLIKNGFNPFSQGFFYMLQDKKRVGVASGSVKRIAFLLSTSEKNIPIAPKIINQEQERKGCAYNTKPVDLKEVKISYPNAWALRLI